MGSELAEGVRKLMRGHENNVRSLFAGREEAAMRQTEVRKKREEREERREREEILWPWSVLNFNL